MKKLKKLTKPESSTYFYIPKEKATVCQTALELHLNLWFHGQSGTGKSEYAVLLAKHLERDHVRVNCSGESSVDDLLGHYTLEGQRTVWVDGALVDAARNGKVLIIDEIDLAPPEVNIALQRALEVQQRKGKHTLHSQKGAQSVDIHPDFSVIVTGNTRGVGEQGMLYVGTRLQNAAFRDRFAFVPFYFAPVAEEARIIEKRGEIEAPFALQIAKFADTLRQSMMDMPIGDVVSTRSMVMLGKLTRGLESKGLPYQNALRASLRATVIEKLSTVNLQATATELIQRVFDIKMEEEGAA